MTEHAAQLEMLCVGNARSKDTIRECASHKQTWRSLKRALTFLGTKNSCDGTSNNPWTATVQLNNVPVQFQTDTGAEVRAIPSHVLKELSGPRLQPPQKTLRGANQTALCTCKWTV